ncbi:hypothetical protein [Pedobacter sp. Leaf194]|uniref:hypothetical protein n=1 Tax=Pedobacter sp. Leaf194 TaxID=1736297 RepID=UPI0012F9D6E7|nr:hypothetical protein [Pedobacter sp. Leaf194]
MEILLIIGCVYLSIQKKWLILASDFKGELLIFFIIITYCLAREFFGSSIFFRVNIFFLTQTIFLPYFLVSAYFNIKNHNNLIKDLILVGSVAAFFTLIMILLPSVADFIRYQVLKTDDFTELVSFRSFGLSEGLTFAFGTAQGIIFALALFNAKKNPSYYFLLPLLLLSIIFNARVGLVPVLFSLVYFTVLKLNIKLLLVIALITILFYLVIFQTSLFKDYAQTIEWAFDFFLQSSDFISGQSTADTNTFDTLFGRMAVLPTDINGWIFGSGENIFTSEQNNSDIGYLIQLNYGGITYLILLFSLVFYMLFRMRIINKQYRWLILLFAITILLSNVKGLFIAIIPSFRLIALIYVYLILERKNKQLDAQISNDDLLNHIHG